MAAMGFTGFSGTRGLFSWNKEYLPFIATAKNTERLVPTKTESFYIK